MKNLEELKSRLMKNENFKKIYEEKRPLMDFIDDILELRYEKGWTQEDLAKAIGTAKSNISRIEKGKQNISYQMMQKLVRVLGGKLFITAYGDRVIRLSKEAMDILNDISRRSRKAPEQIVEESIRIFSKEKSRRSEEKMPIKRYSGAEDQDAPFFMIKKGKDTWNETVVKEFKIGSTGEVTKEWQEAFA